MLVPQDKRGCSKEQPVLQLQGLQIELNLVPTMTERRETQDQSRRIEIEFFVARKPVKPTIFESLILEFVTRLRAGR